jgi:hypothetical protein
MSGSHSGEVDACAGRPYPERLPQTRRGEARGRRVLVPVFVHRGRDRRAWAGVRLDYESDSGGVLAARHESGDPQAPSRPRSRRRRRTRVHGRAQLRARRHPRRNAADAERPEIGEKEGVRDVAVWFPFDFPGGGIRVCPAGTRSGGLGDSATSERTRSERGVLLSALPCYVGAGLYPEGHSRWQLAARTAWCC